MSVRKRILFVVLLAIAICLCRIALFWGRSGLHAQLLTGRLHYYTHGFTDRSVSGLVTDGADTWYVIRGVVDPSFQGMVKEPEGWFYIRGGRLDTGYEGFVWDGDFFWYLTEGRMQPGMAGVFFGQAGRESGWWYVKDSRICRTDDVVKWKQGWWRVMDGKVRFSYEGIAKNENGSWYLKDGQVDFARSGFVLCGDGTYFLEKGRVLGEIHSDSTRFVAHRGLSAKAPENTARAFALAGEHGFWGCETDVWETADHRFVLLHDDTFERMCGDSRKPGELSSDEIRDLQIVSGSHLEDYAQDPAANKVPFLEEYLNICLWYHMVPVVEIKDHCRAGNEADEARLRALYDTTMRIMDGRELIFISFDLESLRQIRGYLREEERTTVTLQYLREDYTGIPTDICRELELGADVGKEGVDADVIAAFHERGLALNVWTVNKPREVYDLIAGGADYITTNHYFW